VSLFRGTVRRGALVIADPDRAATLFLQLICAAPRTERSNPGGT
jgi:hypothetical protein